MLICGFNAVPGVKYSNPSVDMLRFSADPGVKYPNPSADLLRFSAVPGVKYPNPSADLLCFSAVPGVKYPNPSADLLCFSAVTGVKYPNTDVDRLRSVLRDRLRHEGPDDGTPINAVHHPRLDRRRRTVVTAARLSQGDRSTVVEPHRDLV